MKRRTLFLLFLVPALRAADRPLSLDEAYRLSLKQSESLAATAATAEEARARVDELASAVRPHIYLRGSQLIREEAPGRGDNTARSVPEAKVSLEQPLFSGFRDLAAVKAGRALSRAADAEVKRAEHLLYLDVAAAFYDLARFQRETATRDAVLSLTRGRLKEIRERERLGRSRRSEGLSVESLLADLEADRAQEARLEREAQRVLRFLTGASEDLAPAVPEALPAALSLEEALKAVDARPDVAARREESAAAGHSRSVVRREVWPTVDLDGNYYLHREGAQENVDWDLLFSAELPLFRGGAWSARRAAALAAERRARAGYDMARRAAVLDVQAAHDRLGTVLAVLPVLERAAELADANTKAQVADYRLGLVTNLDVLNSLENQQSARLRLEESRLDAHLSAAELAVAQGTLP